jgi:hypothetical protein
MSLDLQTQAARNNAIWCDTIFRSHGKPGEWRDNLWFNRRLAPRFYPNAVTLTPDGQAAQLTAIHKLAQVLPGEFGLKDSFCNLDLAQFGGRLLFEAEWIYRPTGLSKPAVEVADCQWRKITTPSALAEWERAWQGESNDTTLEHIFLPTLLADPTVAIIAGYRDQQIIAGVIANRTGGVVGLSNFVSPVGDAEHFWAGCVAGVIDAFPGLPVVGYEAGEALSHAQAVGFACIGPLRVWVQEHPAE